MNALTFMRAPAIMFGAGLSLDFGVHALTHDKAADDPLLSKSNLVSGATSIGMITAAGALFPNAAEGTRAMGAVRGAATGVGWIGGFAAGEGVSRLLGI
jgi:hypothetical protein